jgi:hypothetical protein
MRKLIGAILLLAALNSTAFGQETFVPYTTGEYTQGLGGTVIVTKGGNHTQWIYDPATVQQGTAQIFDADNNVFKDDTTGGTTFTVHDDQGTYFVLNCSLVNRIVNQSGTTETKTFHPTYLLVRTAYIQNYFPTVPARFNCQDGYVHYLEWGFYNILWDEQ